MAEVDSTSIVLYHYLRALSVKVSRSTVSRLLDTPMSNSMRGISDALDALHIKNEVYQLPSSPDYFLQLDAPFITMLQVSKNPFCIVTKRDDFMVEYNNSEGKKRCIEIGFFFEKVDRYCIVWRDYRRNTFRFLSYMAEHLLLLIKV